MAGKDDCIIQTLLSYKTLCEQTNNHQFLLKDKTILLYVATLLENKNRVQLSLCLDIIESIMRNARSHQVLVATFGLFEAVESLAIRSRQSDAELHERSSRILSLLRESAPPAYSTRSRATRKNKMTSLFLLHFDDLTKDNRKRLESALLLTKGVVSFVINSDNQRCTLRISASTSIKVVLKKVWRNCGMKGSIVSRKRGERTETYIDVLDDLNCTPPPEYFPEEDSIVVGNPLAQRFVPSDPVSWLKSLKDSWNSAFYW